MTRFDVLDDVAQCGDATGIAQTAAGHVAQFDVLPAQLRRKARLAGLR